MPRRLRTAHRILVAAALVACVVPPTRTSATEPAAGPWPSPVTASAAGAAPSPVTASPTPGCPTTVNVVAHQDDDLLFINPDISGDIAAGRCVVTVYLTAGDAGRPSSYWRGREAGAEAAYAAMADVADNWTAGMVTVAGRTLPTYSLDGAPVLLIFLRLPDGHGYAVTGYETLHKLWIGALPTIHAVDSSAAYTKESLIRALTGVMATYRPDVIRTLNFVGPYGDGDHGDHHSAGYFALAAHRNFRAAHQISAYLGYQISSRPANLPDGAASAKLDAFLAYGSHDPHVCQTRSACLDDLYAPWFSRRHIVGTEAGPVRENPEREGHPRY